MERLSLDFKGPVPSIRGNAYLLIVIDEYSRFPFAFPCKDMTVSTVIRCLDEPFTLFGTASFIHSDNGPAFTSAEFLRDICFKEVSPPVSAASTIRLEMARLRERSEPSGKLSGWR